MQRNVGGFDRQLRLVLGAVLVLVGVAGYTEVLPVAVGSVTQTGASLILFVAGAVLLVTGALQWCPVNRVLGRNTREEESWNTY